MNAADAAKANMIKQQIRPWEVLDQQVLSTLDAIDRVDFVDESYKGLAYADCQIPLGHGARMLPPTVEGRMLQALSIGADDEVLEIGSGCGYLTACLAHLAKHVVSIDTRQDIIELARRNLASSGIDRIELEQRSLKDLSAEAAYDAIAVTGSLATVPDNLRQLLKPGGRLFIIIGHSPVMQALLITRVGEQEWSEQSLFETDLPRLAV